MMHSFLIVVVVAICTYITRAVPFWLFRGSNELPGYVSYLGKILPSAIMATLVVYCLRSTQLSSLGAFMPQLIAVVAVSLLHVWKRNTLVSIAGGTAVYMILVQHLSWFA